MNDNDMRTDALYALKQLYWLRNMVTDQVAASCLQRSIDAIERIAETLDRGPDDPA